MIATLAAAALGCPRLVPEQDLTAVYVLLAAFAGLAAGKLWAERGRGRPPDQ